MLLITTRYGDYAEATLHLNDRSYSVRVPLYGAQDLDTVAAQLATGVLPKAGLRMQGEVRRMIETALEQYR